MDTIVYDGVDLSTLGFTIVGITRPLPHQEVNSEHVQGGAANFLRGIEVIPPRLSWVMVFDGDEEDRREAARIASKALLKQEPVEIGFGGVKRYKGAVDGELKLSEFVTSGKLEVEAVVDSAYMKGATKTATVPSGGTVSINVEGDGPTPLKITASSALRNSSSHVWGVRVDNGDYSHVELPSSSSAVVIDADSRTVSVNSSAAQITLDSDWLAVASGTHSVANDAGTGQSTVEWVERWFA